MSRDPRLLALAREKYRTAQISVRNADLFVQDAHDDGWSYREIAEAMGVSASGVRKMVRRNRARDEDFQRRLTVALSTREEE